jgi:ATP-dependent RNA helicase DeaD
MPGVTIEDAPTATEPGDSPVVSPARRDRDRDRDRDRGRGRERDREPDADREEGTAEGFANIFLNVGRRDGLRTADVQRLLVEKAGIAELDVGHIRVRDRITFVGVKKELAERAIAGLVGQTVGDRTINAEPAKERP